MVDFSRFSDVMDALEYVQGIEEDQRDRCREAEHFIHARDGQWETSVIEKMGSRPRYTFDITEPVIDQIMGEMTESDFGIDVRPAGGSATRDIAQVYDGMIRNTENISKANHIYDDASRDMVERGLSGWRVISDFVDDDAFDQDLLIIPVYNFADRVWFDPQSNDPTRRDAKWCVVLTPLQKSNYDEKYPNRPGMSVSEGRTTTVYETRGEMVVIGEILYKETEARTLALMSNLQVFEVNEQFESIVDDLAAAGISVVQTRKRKKTIVYSRKFDGSGWLQNPQRTNFGFLPIIPIYGNFKISESKPIYRGAVEKLMDPGRVYNYARSRQIEEGALSPRKKVWMTGKQAIGHQDTLKTMNINADPVQLYNHVEGEAPPFEISGGDVNAGLETTAQAASRDVNAASGMFASNMGDNPGLQSGVAIGKQQEKGDNSSRKYFQARERAIEHTARVLIDAIPRVYDQPRKVRVFNRDGSEEMVQLYQQVYDQATGQTVTLNDLSQGVYDVTCAVGPAYSNQQQETVDNIVSVSNVDPSIIQTGADVLLNSMPGPGMKQIAERKRAQMVAAGMIPQHQLTKEELAQVQQAQAQGGNQSPVDQALMAQAAAETAKAQAQQADIASKTRERDANTQLKQQRLEMDLAKQTDEIDLKKNDQALQEQKQMMETLLAIAQQIKTEAEALRSIREATGADAIVSPQAAIAYQQQTGRLLEAQSLNS